MSLWSAAADAALDPIAPSFAKNVSLSKAPSPLRSAGALQICGVIFFLTISILLSSAAHAQQPFATDDADVTDKHKFHLQIANEFDILQRNAYPSLRQNTTVFELDYGLFDGVEIGVDYPLIAISNSHVATPRTITGFGDLDFHIKYNFFERARRIAATRIDGGGQR